MGGAAFDEWWKLFEAGIMDPPDLDGPWTLKFEQFKALPMKKTSGDKVHLQDISGLGLHASKNKLYWTLLLLLLQR
jgi:hypothetical protein